MKHHEDPCFPLYLNHNYFQYLELLVLYALILLFQIIILYATVAVHQFQLLKVRFFFNFMRFVQEVHHKLIPYSKISEQEFPHH